jgi:uncharacterized protein
MRGHHLLSSKIVGQKLKRKGKGNYGVFALEDIKLGELLIIWGGNILTDSELQHLPMRQRLQSIMVEEDAFLVSIEEGYADWVNHSCDPNAWLVGQITLFSRRDIIAGEEICFDYGTCLGLPETKFRCHCHTTECRKYITGNDWKLPSLQSIYKGHFMPYLERKIKTLD